MIDRGKESFAGIFFKTESIDLTDELFKSHHYTIFEGRIEEGAIVLI